MEFEQVIDAIRSYDGKPIRIMEVCGTQTHENFRLGIRSILPPGIELISGPGCPVCVTGADYIDKAVYLAKEKEAVICTYGDLVRVPGNEGNLAEAREKGCEIKVVYSAEDAAAYAKNHPLKQVVFLSVGFETTIPSSCLAIQSAKKDALTNFSLLTDNKKMDQVYEYLKDCTDAFLYPGHVSAIVGEELYQQLLKKGISGVIAGFTAKELILAIYIILKKYKGNIPFFVNAYPRIVKPEGNYAARELMERYMEPCDSVWRGLGRLPMSGMKLRREYEEFDAQKKYQIPAFESRPDPFCRCPEVLTGQCKPYECPRFGKGCTPYRPLGACMVSNEGACSAYYQYGQKREKG